MDVESFAQRLRRLRVASMQQSIEARSAAARRLTDCSTPKQIILNACTERTGELRRTGDFRRTGEFRFNPTG